ncbi:MAG: BtrH N-terminal domain-containing protein [Pseudomonadota bacterium]
MIRIDFEHRQSSHCESGVTANLLSHYGVHISEAMAFGIGGGLFFAYMPFIRVNKLPLTTYRCEVGGILKRVTKALGCKVHWRKFKDPQSAMSVLDELLSQGIPVGCRTGAYWLPYFPPAFRFHFNMHNLVVFGKEGGEYLISDPVFPEAVRCAPEALMKARFAQGPLAPNGVMYHITQAPRAVDLAPAIKKGIKMVCRRMLKTPLPVAGVRGIGFLSGRLEKWPAKLGAHNAALHVGQLIRMQEEIGTGGAGFRFMYAAFLQEAAPLLEKTNLLELSRQMTETGDLWRKLAVIGARLCKDRASEMDTFAAMADLLRECATRETLIYQELMESI